jgi:serine/threonine protein kinase
MTRITTDEVTEVLESKGYSLIKEIGRGSSAVCYLVFSRQYHAPFVAKVMQGVTQSSLDCEMAALCGLSHPNVIYLYDMHPTLKAIYLFLEYCPGGSLTTRIANNGVLSGRQLYGVAKQVLTGLCYIHSMRWAHLDLKPANILIDKHGRAKLADFGISRMFSDSGGETRRAGTLEFAAPELFRTGTYDPFKADVWAFAVTVYFMAYGMFPFARAPGDPPPTYKFSSIYFPGNLDPLVRQALKAMLVIDPIRRPTAADCLNLLLFAQADVKEGWFDPPPSSEFPTPALSHLSRTTSLRASLVMRPFNRRSRSSYEAELPTLTMPKDPEAF